MAAKRKSKSLNRQPSAICLPEATPLAIGRSIRRLVANRDGKGLIHALASLMARCEAKLIWGSNTFSKKSLDKWTDLAFLNLQGYRLLRTAENLASHSDDELLGSIFTDIVVETVIKINKENGNLNENFVYACI
jgi:hypothetical protein